MFGLERFGRIGEVGFCNARCGMSWCGRKGLDRKGKALFGSIRFGRNGLAVSGAVRLGMVWSCLVRQER